jgi:NADPH:quinone reductase-like Zn-dependent oxidoreductase
VAGWQGLIDRVHLTTGQTVLVHAAAGGVGSIAVQLARDVGAQAIGTGLAAHRDAALGLGVGAFLDPQAGQRKSPARV